ncbi:Na+/H+ antiporter subunit E [Meiothermus taiwanensis]|jgi:multicomponent Na+:H+ antiporter subunit E|uniref:Na(+)/H(+) antiporter subunit E n=2 Tax=Meiothermus taiwanensis TaxID=172827 RepID=A0A399DSS5_9DEIN|nr:Na+/H+ antiporter subunit E [Meiothermus taiwanensis]AWR85897.1 cation antiporter [Meiothermus taiwanensis WR-220]KIQ53811.1 cation:proton antiporter [Meiothermus taiwanensis]KZK15089.1 cation:proton antiporter [Meiothermus taiwanensis]RIH75087.1 Na(+)/H(+) antiporter subunit E [Meiothermus taiwanensis]
MRAFVYNVVLTIFWMAVTEAFTLENFLVGFVISFLILLLARPLFDAPSRRYFTLAWKLPRFVLLMLWEIVLSSLRVAQAVLSPRMPIQPGIIAYPLEVKSDLEITLLANLITLTPGTLSLDVSSDRKVLYVHGMFVDDAQKVIESTRESLEKAVLEVTR